MSPNILLNWKILVIDDDQWNREVLRETLMFYDAVVSSVSSAGEAWPLMRAEPFDVVLCDLSMPVTSGWALLEQIRADETLLNLPVIALTAHAMKGDSEKALAAGFDGYISKPIEASNLGQRISGLMPLHGLRIVVCAPYPETLPQIVLRRGGLLVPDGQPSDVVVYTEGEDRPNAPRFTAEELGTPSLLVAKIRSVLSGKETIEASAGPSPK